MKKLTIIAFAILGMAFAQPTDAKIQLIDGKFVLVEEQTEQPKSKNEEPIRVPDYPVKDRDGKITYYPCYISKGGKGSAYIIRGKRDNPNDLYRVYLGKEKTKEIKEQLNIQEQ